jgi:hypothetical protein
VAEPRYSPKTSVRIASVQAEAGTEHHPKTNLEPVPSVLLVANYITPTCQGKLH